MVGQGLGGDATAVVADEGDRAQAAPARLPEGLEHAERVAARREREEDVAAPPVGDDLAREDGLGADVVGDGGDDRGVGGEVERGRGGRPGGGGGPGEAGARAHRGGARAAVAEGQQPPAGVEGRAQVGRRGAERLEAVAQRLLAQRSDLVGLHRRGGRDVAQDGVEVVLLLAQERIEKAGSPDVVHALLGAALEQAAVLEEDVHELPEHVVGRLGQLLAHEGVGARRFELALGAERREGHREAAALARQRHGLPELWAVGRLAEGDDDVAGLGDQVELAEHRAGLAGQPDGRQRALAHDDRVHELDGDVTRVRAPGGRRADRHQPAVAREALGHAVAQAREARHPVGRVELLAGLAALGQPALHALTHGAGRGRGGHTAAPERATTSSDSHVRQASMPSPVRALTSMRSTSGCTASRLCRKRSRSTSRCGMRSSLLTSTRSQVRNMSGYFSGLSSPSVTEETMTRASSPTWNSAGHTRLPTFSTMSRSMSCRGSAGSALRTMLASRWHSPPKPGSVLSWVTGTCRLASRSASIEPCTSPSRTPTRTPSIPSANRASSSVVLPAPGELMRLITVTPWASKSARFARAIVLLASSASSTTLTFTRCMRPPVARRRSTPLPARCRTRPRPRPRRSPGSGRRARRPPTPWRSSRSAGARR